MQNKPLPMKLSPDEDSFLRHWIRDEWHYRDGLGAAKQLQVQHNAIPADLALLIAAAYPDPGEQQTIAMAEAPVDSPVWPWSGESLAARVRIAREILEERNSARASVAGE